MKAKSIAFSPDDKFIAITYARNILKRNNGVNTRIDIFTFDKSTGQVGKTPISEIRNSAMLECAESVVFNQEGTCLIICDKSTHAVYIYAFNNSSGCIGDLLCTLSSDDSRVTFPHSVAVSNDGKYLSVANYGDDALRVYDLDSIYKSFK